MNLPGLGSTWATCRTLNQDSIATDAVVRCTRESRAGWTSNGTAKNSVRNSTSAKETTCRVNVGFQNQKVVIVGRIMLLTCKDIVWSNLICKIREN